MSCLMVYAYVTWPHQRLTLTSYKLQEQAQILKFTAGENMSIVISKKALSITQERDEWLTKAELPLNLTAFA